MPTNIFNNFIDGEWVASRGGRVFENRNPADRDDVIGLFQESTPEDAEEALAAARRAYGTWRLVPAPTRAEILFRAAQIIAGRKEQFARDMTREMGKVLEQDNAAPPQAVSSSTRRCTTRSSSSSCRARGRCASATVSTMACKWGRRSARGSSTR